jgi:hypothetical protein
LTLLGNFKYLSNDYLGSLINDIVDYIIKDSGFEKHRTQIVSMSYDSDADSGQMVLYFLKNPIHAKDWKECELVNTIGKCYKKHRDDGRNQIVLVDEFVGSGQTLRNRVKELKNNINGEYSLKCCFIAGMDWVLKELEEEGIEVFCPLRLKRGISDYYNDENLRVAENLMLDLEISLQQEIAEKELFTYTFGYGVAEALYSLEGCNGNTPNSVFPIFWWPQRSGAKNRATLLTRAENGL